MKNSLHCLVLAVELAVFAALVLAPVFSRFPLHGRAYAQDGDFLRFCFAKGQDEVLSSIARFKIYYRTKDDSVLSEAHSLVIPCRDARPYDCYECALPSGLLDFRLDVMPKSSAEGFELYPKFEKFEITRRQIAIQDLTPFQLEGVNVYGYRYAHKPFLNGWLREYVISCAVLWTMLFALSMIIQRRLDK